MMREAYRETLTVDFNKVLCDDYRGMNAVYHGYAFSQEYERRGYTDADREREFATIGEARLRIARTFFKPHYNCAAIEGPYDMHCPRMESIRKWCAKMQEMGIDVAMQAGWHFPRDTHFGREKPDSSSDPEVFANWAASTISYLIDDCGLTNVKYVMLFTEPTSYASGVVPEGYSLWTYYVRVCRAIDKEFRARGLRDRVSFVGPNNTFGGVHIDGRCRIEDGGMGGTNLKEAVRDLDDVIDIYSAHDYNFLHQSMWEGMCRQMADIVAPTGKPFWLDEYGMQPEILRTTALYGNFIAQIQTASMAAGHQTSMIWSLLDQLFPSGTPFGIPDDAEDDGSHHYNRDSFHNGVHRCGVRTFARDDIEGAGSPYESWYAYRLLAQGLGGRLDGGRISICAVEHSLTLYGGAIKQDDDYTVLVVNTNASATNLELRLGIELQRPIYRHVFAPFSDLPAFGTEAAPICMSAPDGTLMDTLPRSGFAIYTTRETL